jgi:hypothetical protein
MKPKNEETSRFAPVYYGLVLRTGGKLSRFHLERVLKLAGVLFSRKRLDG